MARRLKPDKRKINDYGGLSVEEPRLYNIWCGMIQRCENPKRDSYERYGARGIKVCSEWHEFEVFVDWAKANGYDDSLTIDRINSNGNYEPANCRWATVDEQANNKTSNIVLTVGGISGTAKRWADLIGVSEYTIYESVKKRGAESTSKRIADAIRNGDFYSSESVRKTCVKCGKELYVTPGRACTKYCPECKVIAQREKVHRYQQKKKNCGKAVKR